MSGRQHDAIKLNTTIYPCSKTWPGSMITVIESEYLFAEKNEINIRHKGEIYRLRITRNGRLILNK